MLNLLKKQWDLCLAAISAFISAIFLAPNVLDLVTRELISFFSIQAAVVLPAMTLTSGILRSDGLEYSQAKQFIRALTQQMKFWSVLVFLDFLVISLLIFGKAVSWSFLIIYAEKNVEYDLSIIYLFILFFVGLLAFFRTISIIKGVYSLFELSRLRKNPSFVT